MDVPTSFGIKTQERHLRRLLSKLAGKSPVDMRRDIISALHLDRGEGREFVDDVTFIVLQLKLPFAKRANVA